MIEAWFDGSTEPINPGGYTSYGALVKCKGVTVLAKSGYVGVGEGMTNNVAEYAGVIAVMKFLISNNLGQGVIYGDSKMVVYQLSGRMKAKRGAYMPYYREALKLRAQLPGIKLIWIPREQNWQADYLSRQAIKLAPRSEQQEKELRRLIQEQREDRHRVKFKRSCWIKGLKRKIFRSTVPSVCRFHCFLLSVAAQVSPLLARLFIV